MQLASLPSFLPSLPKSFGVKLEEKIWSTINSDQPSLHLQPFAPTDGMQVVDLDIASKPHQIFLNLVDRCAAMRVSPDLVDQDLLRL